MRVIPLIKKAIRYEILGILAIILTSIGAILGIRGDQNFLLIATFILSGLALGITQIIGRQTLNKKLDNAANPANDANAAPNSINDANENSPLAHNEYPTITSYIIQIGNFNREFEKLTKDRNNINLLIKLGNENSCFEKNLKIK